MRNALNSKLQGYTNELFYNNDVSRCIERYTCIPGKLKKIAKNQLHIRNLNNII